jgi:hypothetical protein
MSLPQRTYFAGRLPEVSGFTIEQTASWRVLKDDPASLVSAGDLDGVPTVFKRPKLDARKRWLAWFRQPRAVRAFRKNLRLVDDGLPVEMPLLIARRRTDAFALYARIDGRPLDEAAMEPSTDLHPTLRQIGSVLVATTQAGWVHRDAKTTNWMITPAGLPVMVDCDGFAPAGRDRQPTRGLDRLIEDMNERPGFDASHVETLREAFAEAQRRV